MGQWTPVLICVTYVQDLMGKSEGDCFGDLKWGILKWMLTEVAWEGMDWSNLILDGDKLWAVVIVVMNTMCVRACVNRAYKDCM